MKMCDVVSGTQVGPATNFSPYFFHYFLDSYVFVDVGVPSLTRSRVCSFQFCWALPAQFLSGLSCMGVTGIFYCLFLRLAQPGGPASCIYFPQEQGSSVIPSSIGFV
jgi:hypothetical protein